MLQNKITTNGVKLKHTWSNWPWSHNNINISKKITNDKRRKEWCYNLGENNEIVWGKIQNKNYILEDHKVTV